MNREKIDFLWGIASMASRALMAFSIIAVLATAFIILPGFLWGVWGFLSGCLIWILLVPTLAKLLDRL